MMLGELLLGVFFLVVGYYSSIWTAKRWAKKEINQKAFEKLDLTISDEGFYIANDRKELSTINWESVGNIYETKEFFLFEFVERQISTLPKRVLSAEQQQALIALIQQHFSGAIQSVNK
ncbi:YcxB family protein [Vagococcus xieshaowenii]|nr:YcxB family protein [Vagococcus xieshaowenii]